ncbi:MAG: phosphate signaling complex protein PhoU [Steroidobacteraceae bacterium]
MGVEIEGHTSRAFDGELSSLHLRVVEMGGLVLLQVSEASVAYTEWDHAAAQRVLDREREVDGYDRDIDERALKLIARRQPVATDLRAIMSLAKIVSELERAGDEAKKIALTVLGRAGRVGDWRGSATVRDALHVARLALELTRGALDSLDRLDTGLAAQVIRRDRDLDDEYRAGMRRLLTRAMEDVRYVGVTLNAAFVLKSFERIGDHARNVARLITALS